jgi:hypothetical protein
MDPWGAGWDDLTLVGRTPLENQEPGFDVRVGGAIPVT